MREAAQMKANIVQVIGPSVGWDWSITQEQIAFVRDRLMPVLKELQTLVGKQIEVKILTEPQNIPRTLINAEMLAALEAVMARWQETKTAPPLALLNQVSGAIAKAEQPSGIGRINWFPWDQYNKIPGG